MQYFERNIATIPYQYPCYTANYVSDGLDIPEDFVLRPIYRQTTNYGHFGRAGLPWEKSGRKKDSL
jgi:S-adenosylmethionine synthetase